jgi:hypothetical protein
MIVADRRTCRAPEGRGNSAGVLPAAWRTMPGP